MRKSPPTTFRDSRFVARGSRELLEAPSAVEDGKRPGPSESFRGRFLQGNHGVSCGTSCFGTFVIVARRCRSLTRRFFREESALATRLIPTTKKKTSSR